MRIKKDDNVLIISGKDRGKKGKVRKAMPREGLLLVEGLNMVKRHSRAKGQARQAGIIEREAPVKVNNAMIVCSKCNHPVRIGYRVLDDGKKVRFCRACHEVID